MGECGNFWSVPLKRFIYFDLSFRWRIGAAFFHLYFDKNEQIQGMEISFSYWYWKNFSPGDKGYGFGFCVVCEYFAFKEELSINFVFCGIRMLIMVLRKMS